MRILPLLLLSIAAPLSSAGAQVDPPRDPVHPARLEQVRYPTGGVAVPARMFVAAGAGAHPTALLLHGFPGTELNLDLARALQRSGWNVLAIHYRGLWGAPGQFSFSHTVEDGHAALAWLRSPDAARYAIDRARIVVIGHSMGGFDAAMLGDDTGVAGYVLISAADLGREAVEPGFATAMADDIGYTNTTPDALVEDAAAHVASFDWARRTAQMAGRPVLIVTAEDGLRAAGRQAAMAIVGAGGPAPTMVHMATDHSFNDHRLALTATIVGWLKRRVARR